MLNEKEFLGITDFIWWIGRVESNEDPAEIGRVKVRVFGFHNQDTSKVPTDKLPWAFPIMPTTSASHAKHGFSPTGLEPGSIVLGFWMDGRRGQYPVVLGSIHGFHVSQNIPDPSNSTGAAENFAGSSSDSVPSTAHSMDYAGNAAKGATLDAEQNSAKMAWPTGGDGSMLRIPESPDVGKYPWVQTWQSKDGSTKVEMDATQGAERLKLYHKSKAYIEMDNGGNIVQASPGSAFRASGKSVNDYAAADYSTTAGNVFRLLGQQGVWIESRAAMSINARSNLDIQTDGSLTIKAKGDVILQGNSVKVIGAKGSVDVRAGDECNLEAKNEMNIQAGTSTRGTGAGVSIGSKGDLNIATKGNLNLKGEAQLNHEAEEMSFKSSKIKADEITCNKGYFEVLSWNKTDSTSRYTLGFKSVEEDKKEKDEPLQSAKQNQDTPKQKNDEEDRNKGSAEDPAVAHSNANPCASEGDKANESPGDPQSTSDAPATTSQEGAGATGDWSTDSGGTFAPEGAAVGGVIGGFTGAVIGGAVSAPLGGLGAVPLGAAGGIHGAIIGGIIGGQFKK